MDLADILVSLPDTNHVKRLVAFCAQELHLAPHDIAMVLARAAAVAHAVETLSAETSREETAARAQANLDASLTHTAALTARLTALIESGP